MMKGLEQIWCIPSAIVFILLVQDTHVYVNCQFSAGIKVDHHGPYTIGQTYQGTCDVELSSDDNITNVDVHWNFGDTNYCQNDQKILINRNYSCKVRTDGNTTYFDLRVPDLTIDDGGTYFCVVNHNTRGAKTTFSQTVTVVDPSITTPEAVITTAGREDGPGGSTSVTANLLSTIMIMSAAAFMYS